MGFACIIVIARSISSWTFRASENPYRSVMFLSFVSTDAAYSEVLFRHICTHWIISKIYLILYGSTLCHALSRCHIHLRLGIQVPTSQPIYSYGCPLVRRILIPVLPCLRAPLSSSIFTRHTGPQKLPDIPPLTLNKRSMGA